MKMKVLTEEKISHYQVLSDGYCLLNDSNGNKGSRYELRKGDIITTKFDIIFGDKVIEVSGSFSQKYYPYKLRIAKITSPRVWTSTGYEDCSNLHPNFNPKKTCSCLIHSNILSDITKQVVRNNLLDKIGI